MSTLVRRMLRPFPRRAGAADQRTLHLLCGGDAAYGPWLGVMLASLFRFDHGALHVHVLSDAIEPATLRRIAGMAARAGAGLSIHDIAGRLDAQPPLPLFGHVSRATYGRILAADLLPPAVDRAIYLDVDLLCRASLRALWSCDLGGAVVGAVPDCAVGPDAPAALAALARRTRDLHAVHLGLPADGTYVNGGVTVIDLARWRREGAGAAQLAWLRGNAGRQQFGDQDALNCVLHGRIAILEDGWNRLARWSRQAPDAAAKILHFAGPEKPWHPDYHGVGHGVGGAEWQAVRAGSPFGLPPAPVIPFRGAGR